MTPIKSIPLSDRVALELETQILSGGLRQGDRLVEQSIAREFGVSQGTVREALLKLEARDLVTTEPRKGTFVREVDHAEQAEFQSVRGALHALAVREAMARGTVEFGRLRAAAEDTLRAAETRDAMRYARANADFHAMIIEQSGNAVLLRIWRQLSWQWAAPSIAHAMREHFDLLIFTVKQHHGIVDAMEAGDADTAVRMVEEHYGGVRKYYENLVDEATPEPPPAGEAEPPTP